jgi:hypothetical protein
LCCQVDTEAIKLQVQRKVLLYEAGDLLFEIGHPGLELAPGFLHVKFET